VQRSLESFYNSYWSAESAAPDDDPTTPRRLSLLREYARNGNGNVAVDVGCGRGVFTNALAKLGYQAVGIDLSAKAVEAARRAYPSLTFCTYTSQGKIPLEPESVDLVWCSEVIEHVFDVYGFLSEINRVSKRGARLLLTTPYHGRLKGCLIALFEFGRHFDPYVSHIRFFDKSSLRRCLRDAGFAARAWRGIGRLWPLYRSFLVCAEKAGAPRQRPPIRG